MDLGIKGRTAIVCAGSRGLGRGCAEALAGEGVNLVVNGRDEAVLAETAAAIRAASPEVTVTTVAGDVKDEGVRAALVEAADGAPDILVNNAGGPPPGDFRDWDRQTWIDALDQNMLVAIDLIRRTVDGMAERGFGRVINITSSTVRPASASVPARTRSGGKWLDVESRPRTRTWRVSPPSVSGPSCIQTASPDCQRPSRLLSAKAPRCWLSGLSTEKTKAPPGARSSWSAEKILFAPRSHSTTVTSTGTLKSSAFSMMPEIR